MSGPGGKLVIVGDRVFAEVAHEHFEADSDYDVVAFSVEQDHVRADGFRGLPMFPFERLHEELDPASHSVFAAITYGQLNQLRTRLIDSAAARGFTPASYVSSRASVWRNVSLGEHCFVFDGVTLEPFVTVGRNCVLWSGCGVAHHATVGDNVFIAPQAAISGSVRIGDNCFIGINATLVNDIEIGRDTWIGPGVVITRDVEERTIWRPPHSERRDVEPDR
jgi:sugar O-acyltransferase (sialic acid O-acetyltransferase NeuD family)